MASAVFSVASIVFMILFTLVGCVSMIFGESYEDMLWTYRIWGVLFGVWVAVAVITGLIEVL